MLTSYKKSLHAAFMVVFCLALGLHVYAQSTGSSGSINGAVLDPSGAVVANASVEIHNAVSGYDRTTRRDKNSGLEITLDEGKNRQIRRLLEGLEVQVLRLVRVSIGPLAGRFKEGLGATVEATGKEGHRSAAASGAALSFQIRKVSRRTRLGASPETGQAPSLLTTSEFFRSLLKGLAFPGSPVPGEARCVRCCTQAGGPRRRGAPRERV
jgi:hypothetical protein